MKPFQHKGRWVVQYPATLSKTGKRQQVYFDSEEAAKQDITDRKAEHVEHGRSAVTAQERQWIHYLRDQVGDLSQLPEMVRHWRLTGAGSVTPKTVKEAVDVFVKWQESRVSSRTISDIRWRLNALAEAFTGRSMHQLNAGELETWIYGHGADWSARSFYKRLKPLFAHALRHRWIAEDPMRLLKAPDVPREHKEVYTGPEFLKLLIVGEIQGDEQNQTYLLPAIAFAGLAWLRTSEMVRLYSHEDVLTWEDIDWRRKRIHIRANVGKATKRRTGNERFVSMNKYLLSWLEPCRGRTGRVVEVLHHEFSQAMRKLHTTANLKSIHNGLRRSAISHYLAAHPETGIGQLARLAGTSEATVKRHYLESLTPEESDVWFTTIRD